LEKTGKRFGKDREKIWKRPGKDLEKTGKRLGKDWARDAKTASLEKNKYTYQRCRNGRLMLARLRASCG